MLFDTGPAPKGLGIIEVDCIHDRDNYRVGKVFPPEGGEISYLLFASGNVGISRVEPHQIAPEVQQRIDKRLIELCQR